LHTRTDGQLSAPKETWVIYDRCVKQSAQAESPGQ